MKIVYLSSSVLPSRAANSVHVMKMCNALAANGHAVTLIAQSDDRSTGQDAVDQYKPYGVEQTFDIRRLTIPRVIAIKGMAYGSLAARVARSLKPDLVLCRHKLGCFAAVSLGLPSCLELHAPFGGGTLNRIAVTRLLASQKLRRVVTITHALQNHLEQSFPLIRGKSVVLPDGADPIDEVQPIVLSGAGQRLQVGYTGHLYAGKGMEIIDALARRCDWADFHVVGGAEHDRMTWHARCADVPNVTFHGHVPHNEISRYLRAFDVAVLPNQATVATNLGVGDIGQWTSPLKLFEYMASGKAIIASDLPVLQEILVDQSNALLAEPQEIDRWEQALVRLRDEPRLRNRLGETAREEFLQKYTWRQRAKRAVEGLA